ncbi:hypothetical protein ABZ714_16990 [Streptomyces sp. NPDC006798]|uniref:hypothetical protein n=1 Tax=Streptomyces sp. NPDC006798 TaxID=3155462 RepID=UPI00340600AA
MRQPGQPQAAPYAREPGVGRDADRHGEGGRRVGDPVDRRQPLGLVRLLVQMLVRLLPARGQLRAVRVNWPRMTARGRLLGAVTVGGLAVRAALLLADAVCVLGARATPEYRDRTDALGWALVLPWHLVGSGAVHLALWELVRGDRGWHSVRGTGTDENDGSGARRGTGEEAAG